MTAPHGPGLSRVGGRESYFKQLPFLLLWLLQKCTHYCLVSTYPDLRSTGLPIQSKGGGVRPMTLCAPISFTHPQSDQNKNHKKVSVVKDIIKVINLYLNRPLRVFFSPFCLGEKGNEQDSLVLEVLCATVSV